MHTWPIWVIGGVVLVIAGIASVVVVRNRSRQAGRADAVVTARAALAAAEISRDACPQPVTQADELFQRAELILAGSSASAAAAEAADLAARADRLWRGADG